MQNGVAGRPRNSLTRCCWKEIPARLDGAGMNDIVSPIVQRQCSAVLPIHDTAAGLIISIAAVRVVVSSQGAKFTHLPLAAATGLL